MLKLKNVVAQMREPDYQSLSSQFRTTKADKYLMLLTHMRQDVLSDHEISQSLRIGSGAYYTLKSRLHDKIQEYQLSTILGAKEDILKRVDNIPQLLYDTPRETAIVVLKKMEEDLRRYDMPLELTKVYSALKKLHVHTPKYYLYSQDYNKQVAYAMAIEKVEDIMGDFFKYLGNYSITRDPVWLQYLTVVKDQVANHTKLYNSHHLFLYQYIINISFSLFVPTNQQDQEAEPVEDMLDKMDKILLEHDNNSSYRFLCKTHSLLSFEYYHSLKLHKKAAKFLEEINSDLDKLLLCNFSSFGGHFLKSKVEHYVLMKKEEQLFPENQKLSKAYSPDPVDVPNYILYMKHLAIGALHSKKYFDSINLLNTLINTVSLRLCPHAEIEIKLFHAYCYCIVHNYETAHTLIKSALRKIREMENPATYENASVFVKILLLLFDKQTPRSEEKIINLKQEFLLHNQGASKMLEYLPIQEEVLLQLTKESKRRRRVAL